MRELDIGTKRFTRVVALDATSAGGACHQYAVIPAMESDEDAFAAVHFQNGPVKEVGINGCHNEDLLAIVIDRLECFQAGPFACDANHAAIVDLRSALKRLQQRTADRERRGVEGTSQL